MSGGCPVSGAVFPSSESLERSVKFSVDNQISSLSSPLLDGGKLQLSRLAPGRCKVPLKRTQISASYNSSKPSVPLFDVFTQALWGKGLPPGALVQVARETWGGVWRIMMGQLAPQSPDGVYRRPQSQFRDRVRKGGKYPPEQGRYHLYAALSCPWAHRTLIVHALKGLGDAVPVSVAVPGDSGLWEFRPNKSEGDKGHTSLKPTKDRANGCDQLKEVYGLINGGYNGRATVPMLWDSKTREVVNNESAEIIEILNSSFNEYAEHPDLDLSPAHLQKEIDDWNGEIYENVNNGVYRCGFATSQESYSSSVEKLFMTLDKVDNHLESHRYLCGDCLTLADVRLFTTLLRFDAVYYSLFKCSRRRVSEYPRLAGFLRELYQMPSVAGTCDVDIIVQSYFGTLFPLNPGGIVPVIPYAATAEGLLLPHNR